MAIDTKLLERLESALKRKRGITQKKMFGGVCFLHHGNMLCGVDNKSRVMLRVGPDRYEEILKMKHANKMDFTGKPMKGMVYISPNGTKSIESLKEWVDLALKFTKTLPKK